MLIARPVLEQIVAGEVTLQFRRWTRPTVKAGGTLRTAVGVLAIDAVDAVPLSSITAAQARRAGAPSRKALLDDLRRRGGTTYRIEPRRVGPDERTTLREDGDLTDADGADITTALDGMDRRSRRGPWTRATLDAIARNSERPAAVLAEVLGHDKLSLKRDVRRLKELGLTESLNVGYRLSARGQPYLTRCP